MALFGLFQTKRERDLEAFRVQAKEMIFPGGDDGIERDVKRIDALTNGKIPSNKLRGFVAGCKMLQAISEVENESRFVASFIARSEGRISESEAYNMYVYFAGECDFYDKLSRQLKIAGGNIPNSSEKLLGDMPWIYSQGVYTDEIHGGQGEYGLVASNPIPTISIKGSNAYLSRLKYAPSLPPIPGFHFHPKLPCKVEANRIGSTSSSVTPGSVDIYELAARGMDVCRVFICPYHKTNSKKAPKGFILDDGDG